MSGRGEVLTLRRMTATPEPLPAPTIRNIRFVRRGEVVTLGNVPPSRTLLEVLREDLCATGTKEGCGEGDCGACTVVLAEPDDATRGTTLRFKAVNSCIRLAHSIDGMALWTVEDIAAADGTLHPAQEAMLQCHASQCGFCTPGFVMSLFGLYQDHVAEDDGGTVQSTRGPITREVAQQALSGNLCRCTGYRPILDAAQRMSSLPVARLNHAETLQKLEHLKQSNQGQESDFAYISPTTLAELLRLRSVTPSAQLVAGCTDVGLWVTKQHRQFAQVLDLTRVEELRRVVPVAGAGDIAPLLRIGAAVTLADALAALVAARPQLHGFASRFAGLPVRNSGTLGGNVANGSPIGDAMPLLIALNSSVVLASVRAERTLALEQLYTGYRKNVMAADEVLTWVQVPGAVVGENVQVYKISKRFEDDISAVCLALNLRISDGVVTHASVGVGGVAATPVRAVLLEAALRGQPWCLATVQQAMAVLRAEFTPLSDMRASAAYRTQVLGNLLQRYWLESQGLQGINLQSYALGGAW